MKTIRFILLLIFNALGLQSIQAQVPKNTLVEHFTNTRCSICGSRNPGFYQNLSQHPQVMHIAYHPSAPYKACILNQHNTAENDARTNYYGVYGATPRLIISGKVIPSFTDYDDAALFQPFMNQLSDFDLKTNISRLHADSVTIRVTLTIADTHQVNNLRLYVAVAEQELRYAAPNGEQLHHDVFRKVALEMSFTPLSQKGDSVTWTSTIWRHPAWNLAELYPIAIINNDATKEVLQAAAGDKLGFQTGVFEPDEYAKQVQVFPNPVHNRLYLTLPSGLNHQVALYNQRGEEVYRALNSTSVLTEDLPDGLYILVIQPASCCKPITQKILIAH